MDSYRCYRVWVGETQRKRVCDTVAWLPNKVPMPTTLSTDIIMAALESIEQALVNPCGMSPLAPMQVDQAIALKTAMDCIRQTIPPTDVKETKVGITVGMQYKQPPQPVQQSTKPTEPSKTILQSNNSNKPAPLPNAADPPVISQSQENDNNTPAPAQPLRVKAVTFNNNVQTRIIPARRAGN